MIACVVKLDIAVAFSVRNSVQRYIDTPAYFTFYSHCLLNEIHMQNVDILAQTRELIARKVY